MKKTISLIVLFTLFFQANVFAQKKSKSGKIDVVVLDEFVPSSSITIMADNDPLMIRSKIESELMFSEINLKVVSPTAAERTISAESKSTGSINSTGKGSEGRSDQKISVDTQETILLPTVYALTFEYNYNPATGGLMNFSGEIIDLRDGTIVVKFRRQGSSGFGYGVSKKNIISELISTIIELSN
jgi:hypothetical protein